MKSNVRSRETATTQVDATLETCEMDLYDSNVPKKHRGTDADRRDMQIHGRKQELHRIFGFASMMGFGSTLICTWELILAAAVSSSLLNGGTAGLVWGFFIAAVAFLFIYASLAEMTSMSPVSCGQYHWVSEFSPRRYQKYLSYLTGWLCTLGWQTALSSGAFIVGTILQGLITLHVSTYEPQPWHGTLMTMAVGCGVVVFNTCFAKKLPFVEGLLLMLHVVGLFAIIIPLWVLAPRNNTKAVFTEFTNNGGWSTNGVSFMIGLLPLVLSVLGFDSSVHMAEEVENAAITLPRAIMWSTFLNSVLGLVVVITICYTWGDMDEIRSTRLGFPFLQVFYNTTRSRTGTTIMAMIIVLTILASVLACNATASRQLWSFARDHGVPFSPFFAQVSRRWGIPANAVLTSLVILCLLSLINLGSLTALNAMFALTTGSLLASYILSIGCVVYKRLRGDALPPREWTLGRYGLPINIVSLHMRDPKQLRTLWIDAVCINQDDLNERGKQVLRMRDIYAVAVAVEVWLGKTDDDDDVAAMDLVGRLGQMVNDPEQALAQGFDAKYQEVFLEELEQCTPEVVQELSRARQEMAKVSWFIVDAIISDAFPDERLDSFTQVIRMAQCRRINLTHPPFVLQELLNQHRDCEATDPRDKVFGLLGLSGDVDDTGIEPDHTSSPQNIYADLFRKHVIATGSLDMICANRYPKNYDDLAS
ncbi:hypothetical protein EPUS_08121 [Endocarpon pusillum Z07020]|uniref:Heterokaryon incompatibility domain-containing protein n=1 Tax=Endocarpon pusillum (strain Z07020 / HMAS-L-300199) TaxID=1263415 RepID=U1GP47_ENDPU|nr:uncharacterized protein EPUS_08121 [Endocarpon pusillum Z07020]ERF74073.1 hypothetical protein EPUS_08121 [Endocarpon pusillum Z07020]